MRQHVNITCNMWIYQGRGVQSEVKWEKWTKFMFLKEMTLSLSLWGLNWPLKLIWRPWKVVVSYSTNVWLQTAHLRLQWGNTQQYLSNQRQFSLNRERSCCIQSSSLSSFNSNQILANSGHRWCFSLILKDTRLKIDFQTLKLALRTSGQPLMKAAFCDSWIFTLKGVKQGV